MAHPDDDAYGMAGTVALHADDPGFRFVLIHATDGGAGDIRDGFPATRETLGEIRRAECEAAWRAHGRVPDRHEWLGFPDGGLADMSIEELVDSIATILEEEQPTVVGTFGPDGIFGHPDHITVGAATDAVFLRWAGSATAAANGSFQRLLHGAIPNRSLTGGTASGPRWDCGSSIRVRRTTCAESRTKKSALSWIVAR